VILYGGVSKQSLHMPTVAKLSDMKPKERICYLSSCIR